MLILGVQYHLKEKRLNGKEGLQVGLINWGSVWEKLRDIA